jgi:hypothetical protein
MRRIALILAVLMVAGVLVPTAQAHADTNSQLAVYMTYDTNVVYSLGSDVKINILVYWEGEFHDPVGVSFLVSGTPTTTVRRDTGKYEANFQIQSSHLDGGTAVSCTVFVNEGSYPAPSAADTVYVMVKSLEMDIVVMDSHDRFMSPGDDCEFQVRTSYNGAPVDPDDGTLYVYRQRLGSALKGELTMKRLSLGVFAGTLTTSALNRSDTWYIGCEAEYTTRGGVVYGFSRDSVDIEMFPLWVKRAAISTTGTTLEFHVWEKNGWPLPDSVEGYPLAGAYVELDYKYRDETLVYQVKTVQGSTGVDGSVSLDLVHPDMRTGDIRMEVVGYVRVGMGIDAHRQNLEFLLPVREYPDYRDGTGFDVQLHNYYIPEWTTLTTLGHTARFDGQPLVGAEIFVYIAEDDVIYYADSVLTGPGGQFNVQLKTPTMPDGERMHIIDKCEYQVKVVNDWYMDSNWLYIGEANLYGAFNQTHDESVSLSVNNLAEYQMVTVTVDHPEADGTDETAWIAWGMGDPWDYWINQDWLYDLLWAPVRSHWSVAPENFQHVTYVPAVYKGGQWVASFYLPGFLDESWDIWVHGRIQFTDTLSTVSATLRDLDPEQGRGWPDVAITTPPPSGIQEGVLNISGVASDDDGLERVDIRVDGGDWIECAGLEDWFYEFETAMLDYGTHSLEARSWNGYHYSKVVSRPFFTDQRPRVTVENPEDGGHYYGELKMNGTAWDDLLVDAVQVQVDGGAWTDAYGKIQWELGVDLTSMDSGEHTLAVKAIAGSTESDAQRLVFVVDRPPEVVITDPPANAELAGTVHVKGTAKDDLSLLEIHLSIDSGDWFPADEDTDWSYALDTTSLTYGEHYIEAKAWDGYEWSDTAYVAFTVDNPPEITAVSLVDGQVVSGIHEVDGESKDDNHGEDHVLQVQIRGSDWEDVPLEENGDWSYDIDTTVMTPGTQDIKFRIYDGKQYSSEWTFTFLVDEPPVVGDMSIDTGDTLGGTVTITGETSDDTGVDGVQVRIDGGDWVDVDVDVDGNWSHDMDTTGLSHGDHTLEVRVSDGVQWSGATSVEFSVDQMPIITIVTPEAGVKYKKDFEFNGTASDDDAVTQVEFRLDGGEWETADGTQVWNYAVKAKDLKNGEHTVEARAYDGTQYSDTVSVTFTVEVEEKDGPGFSAVVAAIAMMGALIALERRRH